MADLRDAASRIWTAGLAAVDPRSATRRWVDRNKLPDGRLWVVALGKGAVAMARGTRDALGDRAGGVALVHDAGFAPVPGFEVRAAGHPVPDARGAAAADSIEALAAGLGAEDTLLVLLSGGGSALLADPCDDLGLEGLIEGTQRWLRDGAPIQALNAWRIANSRLKGGGLGRLAHPARVVTLVLSDVPDQPELVASGPTAGTELHVIGSLDQALQAACDAARADGWTTRRWDPLHGEARAVGARLGSLLANSPPGTAWITGGECTVRVRGSGLGGRCQELATAAVPALHGTLDAGLWAAGTDGRDGPTDAAGAWVDGSTDPQGAQSALDDNDTGPWLERRGARIVTGATGTNVGDVVVGLRGPAPRAVRSSS